MGSKKIKYITIDDTGGPGITIADPEKFKTQARILAKALLDHPVTGQGLPTYGTNVLINILNEAGGLPTKNFRFGQSTIRKKSAAKPCMTSSLRGGHQPWVPCRLHHQMFPDLCKRAG